MGNKRIRELLMEDWRKAWRGERPSRDEMERHTIKVFREWNKFNEEFKRKHGKTPGEMFGPK